MQNYISVVSEERGRLNREYATAYNIKKEYSNGRSRPVCIRSPKSIINTHHLPNTTATKILKIPAKYYTPSLLKKKKPKKLRWLLKLFMSPTCRLSTKSPRVLLSLASPRASHLVWRWTNRRRLGYRSFWWWDIEGTEWTCCNRLIRECKLSRRIQSPRSILPLNIRLISSNLTFRWGLLSFSLFLFSDCETISAFFGSGIYFGFMIKQRRFQSIATWDRDVFVRHCILAAYDKFRPFSNPAPRLIRFSFYFPIFHFYSFRFYSLNWKSKSYRKVKRNSTDFL